MNKKCGLGFGLNKLLDDIKDIHLAERGKYDTSLLQRLPLNVLKAGKYQPRRSMNQESLVELKNSILTQGIIQPIIVRPLLDGAYEIIAGERRWRAAQMANFIEVPVIIRELSDEQTIALSLIENIQREDLNAIDTAVGLQRLIGEFNMTHANVASAVGKSRVTITNLLRLLELPDEVKEMVRQNQLEMGHARALLTLDFTMQLDVASTIISKKLSVRSAETLVHQIKMPKEAVTTSVSSKDTIQLQKQLADKLAIPVRIYHTQKGSGKMVVKYNRLSELENMLQRITSNR